MSETGTVPGSMDAPRARKWHIKGFFDQSPIGLAILECTFPHRVIKHNRAYAQSWPEPYRTRGVVRCGLCSCVPRAEERGMLAAARRVADTGHDETLPEFSVDDPVRGCRWYRWSLTAIHHDGHITAFGHMVEDVTEEVTSRRALLTQLTFHRQAEDGLLIRLNDATRCDTRLQSTVEELRQTEEELRASLEEVSAAEQENRRINEELRSYVNRLEDANKELDAFSYSVSHDLRAPLRGINGFADLLADRTAGDPETSRLAGLVRASGQRMGRLIDDLLHYAQQGRAPLQTVRVNVDRLVAQVVQELQTDHPMRHLAFEVTPLPPACADPTALRQIFFNLLSNAVKYTAHNPVAHINVGGRIEGSECRFWVQDDGVGFDMAHAQRLFGLFQRLHGRDEFEGTGAGLAIVRRLIRRHDGRVWAEAEPGRGATFWFTLPDDLHVPNSGDPVEGVSRRAAEKPRRQDAGDGREAVAPTVECGSAAPLILSP